jgi:hypothetical protein
MVLPGLIIFRFRALRRPKRMRLSTYGNPSIYFKNEKQTYHEHLSAIDDLECLEVQDTRTDNIHGGGEVDGKSADFG